MFEHYNTCFDAVEVVRKYAVEGLSPAANFLTNFLGVRIDPMFLPEVLRGREGQVEPLPIPANWHADVAEWGAVLRAVDLAPGPRFVMAELGCGWGCWMSNSGTAARNRSLIPRLIGVEGDQGHCEFARQCLRTNGFDDDQFTILRGIAAVRSGQALFPKQKRAGVAWGLEPILDAAPEQVAQAKARGTHDAVDMVGLGRLFKGDKRIDLLHIDIQGGENELLEHTVSLLNERVAYIVVGTHSRQIEGGLFSLLLKHGWLLEVERPALLSLNNRDQPSVAVDGVQGWRNPRLLPVKKKLVERLWKFFVRVLWRPR